jgi:hypothetical protein
MIFDIENSVEGPIWVLFDEVAKLGKASHDADNWGIFTWKNYKRNRKKFDVHLCLNPKHDPLCFDEKNDRCMLAVTENCAKYIKFGGKNVLKTLKSVSSNVTPFFID